MTRSSLRAACGTIAAVWTLAGVSAPAHDRIKTTVTWVREIGPLLERRCTSCHAREGYAFPLTTYGEARPWAVAIKEETLAGTMPPWGAAPGIGHFANDRTLTRHELELIAAWVDGGAPEAPRHTAEAGAPAADPESASLDDVPASDAPAQPGTFVPLASAVITEATQRTASVSLEPPAGMSLIAWSFEPGTAALVERADLELGTRWLGTWTPGEGAIEFPSDAAVPLGTSALFTARVAYRAPEARVVDYSGLRIWVSREPRPRIVRETTVVRSWRTPAAVDVVAIRPTGTAPVEAVARFASGSIEPLGRFTMPSRGPHPTYRLARPLALPAGARVEVTGAVRLLYTDDATRTVKPNVRRRPRR